jgi:hypothetical protein
MLDRRGPVFTAPIRDGLVRRHILDTPVHRQRLAASRTQRRTVRVRKPHRPILHRNRDQTAGLGLQRLIAAKTVLHARFCNTPRTIFATRGREGFGRNDGRFGLMFAPAVSASAHTADRIEGNAVFALEAAALLLRRLPETGIAFTFTDRRRKGGTDGVPIEASLSQRTRQERRG